MTNGVLIAVAIGLALLALHIARQPATQSTQGTFIDKFNAKLAAQLPIRASMPENTVA